LITAFFNPESLVSLLKDYRVYSRMLIAVPVLLLSQLLLESRFRMVVAHIKNVGLLETPELARMDDASAMLLRLRDSLFPELAILLLVIVHTGISYKSQIDASPWLAKGAGSALYLTPAGWYAVLVSATIFQFLLGLSLWKWLLWTLFAFKLSRLDLKLVPTHPDQHGGLGFLGEMPVAFAPVAFAAATVIGAAWRYQILHLGRNPMGFKLPAIAFVVIIALIALGPLLFFVPRLEELRRRGTMQYGALGQMHSTDFHQKWIHQRTGHEAEFLTAPESSTLADLGRSYEKLEQLKPLAINRGSLITLAIAVVVPLLPALLAVVPLATVLKTLLEALR
jgi:hypothetical protein